jgi:hypothetical protein
LLIVFSWSSVKLGKPPNKRGAEACHVHGER